MPGLPSIHKQPKNISIVAIILCAVNGFRFSSDITFPRHRLLVHEPFRSSVLANFAILFIIVEVRYKGMVSPTGE
jgi:hypothetical protein